MALAQLASLLMAGLLSQATGGTSATTAPTNAQSSGGVTTGTTPAQSTGLDGSNAAANSQILREMEALRKQNAALAEDMEAMRKQNKSLEGSVADLQVQQNGKWLSEERAKEVRNVVEDVLKDADSRTSLTYAVPTAGFGDRGFFIASPDGNFRLNLSGQLQIRYAANFLSSRDYSILNANPGAGVNRNTAPAPSANSYNKSTYGFEIRRMKLDFFGHVIDPSWQYRLILIYNQNQNAAAVPAGNNAAGNGGSSNAGMEEAMVIKDLGDGFKISVGQFKSPFLREEIVSSRRQLAVERSLVDQMFSTKFTQGVMGTWTGDHLMFEAMYNDGGSNANTGATAAFNSESVGSPQNLNNGAGFTQWAITAHAGWLAYGHWNDFNDLSSYPGEGEGLMFNAWLNMQRGGEGDTSAIQGTNNIPLNGNSDAQFLTWSVDASWHFGGANLFSYFVMNTAYDIPATTTNNISSINSYGAVVQGGYFITNTVELFGRWEWLSTQSKGVNDIGNVGTLDVPTVANVFNAGRTSAYTAGFNWFIHGRQIKLTTDIGFTTAPLWFNNGIYGAGVAGTNYRIEPDGGGGQIVVRSQLQLLF
jgi:Phosphate-selective porin O and P